MNPSHININRLKGNRNKVTINNYYDNSEALDILTKQVELLLKLVAQREPVVINNHNTADHTVSPTFTVDYGPINSYNHKEANQNHTVDIGGNHNEANHKSNSEANNKSDIDAN